MEKYTEIKKLGSGAFGTVYHVRNKSTGEDFAMKKLSGPNDGETTQGVQNEVKVLSMLNHPNIVRYIESFLDKGVLCIVMEYCPGGDLRSMIRKERSIPEKRVVVMFCQLCQAVDYIHNFKPQILHRDIKPENILFSSSGDLKLCDFGVSKLMESYLVYAETFAGTPCYMAPEVLRREKYTSKCDIWSMGCVLYEICTFKYAFESRESAIRGIYAPPPSSVNPELRDLIGQMLSMDAKSRPSAGQILQNPVIKLA